MFNQMLTGGGGRFNGGNRWFDKTVQVGIIFQLRSSDVRKTPSSLQHEHRVREDLGGRGAMGAGGGGVDDECHGSL